MSLSGIQRIAAGIACALGVSYCSGTEQLAAAPDASYEVSGDVSMPDSQDSSEAQSIFTLPQYTIPPFTFAADAGGRDVTDSAVDPDAGTDADSSDECSKQQRITYCFDYDGDLYGTKDQNQFLCPPGKPSFTQNCDDCNDLDKASHPNAVEVCDGKDNDCDGQTDEGIFEVQPCGYNNIGACTLSEEFRYCKDGVMTEWQGCTAVLPVIEVCDHQDNDCNGKEDDGLVPQACSTTCGTGLEFCVAGKWQCDAPQQSIEICDGLDNDCDGLVDESFNVGEPCFVGNKYCLQEGQMVCTADGSTTYCDAKQPTVEDCCGDVGAKKNIVMCEPASFAFLFDNSGSMEQILDIVKQDVLEITELMEAKDYAADLALMLFKDYVEETTDFTSVTEFNAAISAIDAEGGLSIAEGQLNALIAATTLSWPAGKERYVILLSDSYFHEANEIAPYSMEEVATAIDKANINVIMIAYGDLAEMSMNTFASYTGIMFAASNVDELSQIFQTIAEVTYKEWDECSSQKSWIKKSGNCAIGFDK